MDTFETPAPVRLRVRTADGRVRVRTADTDRTTVALEPLNDAGETAVGRARVEQSGDAVLVDVPRREWLAAGPSPAIAIEVTVPTGSSVDLHSEGADLRAEGDYAGARCTSGKGQVDVGTVRGDVRLKTGSSAISADRVEGRFVASTGAGDVALDESGVSTVISVGSGEVSIGRLVGDAVVKTGSGEVGVGVLAGDLLAKTGSGAVSVRRATSGRLVAKTATGDVVLGIEQGTAAWLDLSTVTGRVRQDLAETAAPPEGGQRIEITARTVSGDLRVQRAGQAVG